MRIYLNDVKWPAKADWLTTNVRYPFTQMAVGDIATIVPRSNLSPIDLHSLDHQVRAAAYAQGRGDPAYTKTFSTNKTTLRQFTQESINQRTVFVIKRTG
jgi:hypothetical protein